MNILKILCKFNWHKYEYVKRVSPATHKIKCTRCGTYFAINTDTRCVLKWDLEIEDMFYQLRNMYNEEVSDEA